MGYGIRYFLIEQDGTLRQVSQRVTNGLRQGIDRLPQYAGQSLRVANVYLDTEQGKPRRIFRIEGGIWHFDAQGGWDEDARTDRLRAAMEALDSHGRPAEAKLAVSAGGPVVDISAKLDRQRWERRHRWEPDQKTINQIIHAIWPETAGRPVERPKTTPGTRRRKPPMTYQSERAMREVADVISSTSFNIGDLGLVDVKAFIAACRERSEKAEPVDAELWLGAVRAGERRLAILEARRSPKGKWYAAVERIDWKGPDRREGAGTVLEVRECDGRKAAVAASRELLRKYADLFDATVQIDVECYPEIEHQGRPEALPPG